MTRKYLVNNGQQYLMEDLPCKMSNFSRTLSFRTFL